MDTASEVRQLVCVVGPGIKAMINVTVHRFPCRHCRCCCMGFKVMLLVKVQARHGFLWCCCCSMQALHQHPLGVHVTSLGPKAASEGCTTAVNLYVACPTVHEVAM